ncbi:hypothetical protein QBC35DRAFT_290110 [Podospora australis]|uniref:Carrier domain-containing protein n=1 Tax=Podospora australis TaxID=1536484 RepID=A0AAN7AG00_9PEZI|nr:hypothetical protein QBC35DRAFT_290110 [Podospora australis]
MGSIAEVLPMGNPWQGEVGKSGVDVSVDTLDLRGELEKLAASALGITVRKLRNNNDKTWIRLGGDSLTAVNFMGACHAAGINLNIPDIIKAESIDDLLRRIVEGHIGKENEASDGDEKAGVHRGLDVSDDLRGFLNGSIDEIEGVGACSPMQENFMAVQSLDPSAYQLKVAAIINSTDPDVVVSTDAARRAWKQVVEKHAALRTSFIESVDRPGRLDQIIWRPGRNAEPEISVFQSHSEAEAASFDGHYASRFAHHLILAPAAAEDNGRLYVSLVISHALIDGVSIELLFQDFLVALTGQLPSNDRQSSMPCDLYIEAQQPDMSPEALGYWAQYTQNIEGTFLKGALASVESNATKKPTGLYAVDDEVLFLQGQENQFEDLKATVASACQVAFALVLGSYTGSSDVCFSYTASGRQKRIRGLQGAVGNFVNTLPCRVNLTDDPTVEEAVQGVQADFLESLPFQGASLGNVQQLGDCLLSFQRGLPAEELVRAGFEVDVVSWEAPSDYNYNMAVSIDKNRLGLRLSTWESLTPKEDAHNLMQLFRDSLEFVLRDVSRPCSDFVGITAADRAKILANNRQPYHLPRKCVHDQVRSIARQQPSSQAIQAWDGDLTYSELDTYSDRIALHLLHRGLPREGKVGIYMAKSRWAPTAMLGVLKAGGVVVPLGIQDPLNRIGSIARSAEVSIVLADPIHAEKLLTTPDILPFSVHVIYIDDDLLLGHSSLSSNVPLSNIWPDVMPDNAAWIVFTSGSTGIPKAVVLEHKTLCAPMYVQAERYNLGPSTRALQFSAHTFDVAVKDIFTTLTFGGVVCVPSEHQRLNDLAGAIRSMRVTLATLTPTVASLLDPADVPTLTTIVSTGEALSGAVLQPWLEDGRVTWFNGYGPSECSHVSTINGPIRSPKEASIIGLPAANRLWVVDPRNVHRLSPIGAAGELLIEGAIAREYLNNPEGTAAAFIVDPDFVRHLGLTQGRRMYRTGDLVRQNKDGRFTYLGRKDTQVKIRGQRVEVGEIESRISRLLPGNPLVQVELLRPATLIAAVELRGAARGAGKETAPVMPCEVPEDLREEWQNIQNSLMDDLPLHMVPNHFVPFSQLPTNASGKLDRRATRLLLERLHAAASEQGVLDRNNPAKSPRTVSTETGKRLQSIWADVLGRAVDEIGDNDHFMRLGGDSVVAMRMVGVARKQGVQLSVADIIQNPRLVDMARVVDEFDKMAAKAAADDTAPFELWKGFLAASDAEQQVRLVAVADQCDIPANHVVDVYPTSPLQEGLMAMTSQHPGTYVAQQVFRMGSEIDIERFKNAWAVVASSLTILRTRIVYTQGEGSVQVVTRDAPLFTTASMGLMEFLDQDRTASFVYGTRLHRFCIVNDGDDRYFAWTAHHSAYDGTTVSRTLKMVAEVYQGGSCHSVTPSTRFFRSLGQGSDDEVWQQSRAYWRKELENAQLTRFPESPSLSYRPFADGVHRHRFSLPPSHSPGRVSVAILLRAAWALVVSGSTGNDEAMLAIVLSGRDVPVVGIEDVIAPTITTVPARIQIDRSKAVVDFLSAVDAHGREMAPHTQFGLANIRREVPGLGQQFDPGHLFVVHFGTPPEDAVTTSNLGLERMTGERQNFEGYNLVVECALLDDAGSEIEVETHFDPNVLARARVDELMSRLEHIAHELQRYNVPDAALDESKKHDILGGLDVITPAEKQRLLGWNKPIPDALEITLDRLVAKHIAASPHAQAVCSRGRNLTYAQLDDAAGRLAQLLVTVGVGPEVLVGVCMDKSEFAAISMLAIIRAGGGVVPLGIQFPSSRLETLVSDAQITVALVDETQAKRFNTMVPHPVVVDWSLLDSLPCPDPDAPALSRAGPGNPAWVIFTSGSTGVPKGVVLEHRALSHGVLANGLLYGVTPATRNFQFSAFTFDVSITDIFTTWAYGGCVCFPSERDRIDGITTAMQDFAVTFAVLTPTVTSLLDPAEVPDTLDTIVFVGEAIKPAAVEPWYKHIKCFNGYGPAECSIYSVINGPITRPEDAPIIGTNVANRLWLTHPADYNALVPLGTAGELLIEGHSLAREYLHDPKKTAASFIVDPKFAASLGLPQGRRMYRTGDLVRQDPDTGLFTCLGRLDSQIKIRGQRVQVGEIESQIVKLQPSVQHACVDLIQLRGAPEPMLLAAVELQADIGSDSSEDLDNELQLPTAITSPSRRVNAFLSEVRACLSQILPLYMIPAHFIPMTLPVNASGKLDRRATREILETLDREQLRAFSADRISTNGEEEQTQLSDTENRLRLLWAQVLGLQGDGNIQSVNDNFFELGGDSVTAMRLAAAARAATVPLRLGVMEILMNPRLGDMARVAEENSGGSDDGHHKAAAAEDPKPFELWNGFLDAPLDEQRASLAQLAEQCPDLGRLDEIVDVYPATALQEGLMAITSRQTSAYVAQQVFRLSTDMDVSHLHSAWELMSSRLAILRTRIVYTSQGTLQIVTKSTPEWEYPTDLESYLARDQSTPFSYGSPLHRLAVVKDGPVRYFVWTVHHAAYDGWTLQLALRMLIRAYQDTTGASLNQEPMTPIPRFIRYLEQVDDTATKDFWRGQLEDAKISRFPHLPSLTYQPCAASLLETHIIGLSADSHNESNNQVTAVPLGAVLRAAWAATVATYTSSDEATMNITLSGRDLPVEGIANVVGPTLTTVPVRVKLNKAQSVDEFLRTVDEQAREMASFAHVGLHRIRNAVPSLGSDFDAGHLFIIQPAPTEAEQSVGSELEGIGLELDTNIAARGAETRDFGGYALAVDCTASADSVHIEMRYDSTVLPHPRAAQLLTHFEHAIRQLNINRGRPTVSLSDIDLFFSPADAEAIRGWNEDVPPTTHCCIHDLICEAAGRSPDAQAIEAWDGSFSYASLIETARRLARHLNQQYAVGPEISVGLCMDKSRWAVVSMLAILIAGGAVVPLGVQLPISRLAIMVQDAKIGLVLVDKTHAVRLSPLQRVAKQTQTTMTTDLITINAPFVESLPLDNNDHSLNVSSTVSPTNAAWVVFTSGSTGTPKGVILEHKSLCSSFAAHGPRVGFGPTTRAFQFSAYTFDNAIEDILSVLTFGGCVCVPSEDQRLNDLAATIRHFNANLLNATPTMASLLKPADVPTVKTLLLGGETVSPAAVEPWLGHAKVINTYGPAECSVDVACSVPMQHSSDAFTIGLPLGVNFWVTNPADHNQLTPVGMPGELLVEGPHLGRGYINDAEKTAKNFVRDPDFVKRLGLSTGRRFYRTGDLVQQNPDGSLVHLGRIDTQIKIRGQRVEIGEIESQIVNTDKAVRIACVDLISPSDGSAGDPMLVAAIEIGDYGPGGEGKQLEEHALLHATGTLRAMVQKIRAELFLVLPRYMVPHIVPMLSLPSNASGKLDRRATREILSALSRDQLSAFEESTDSSSDRPLTPMEHRLRGIWVDMLGCSPSIGPNAHFVQLGGDSVIAMRIVAAGRGAGLRIGVVDILNNPRLADLARIAGEDVTTRVSEPDPTPFELWRGFTDISTQQQQAWLSEVAERCGLDSHEIEDVYPATPLQEGLMAVTADQPEGYFAQFQFRMSGVDLPRFKAAWGKVTASLAIMRTRIVYDAPRAVSVQVVSRASPTWGYGNDLDVYLAQDKALKFAYGMLLHRLAIVETKQDETYFVWTLHHSGYDGYQVALTLNMLAELYQAGGPIDPPPPPVSRFIRYLEKKDKHEVASYWKHQLEGVALARFPPIPNASYRPEADSASKARINVGRTGRSRASIATLLQAAWSLTVGQRTGIHEATSAVALAARNIPVPDIGSMAVPTLATVPMRVRFDDRKQLVSEFLASLAQQAEEMLPFLHTGMQHIRAMVPGLGVDFDPGHLFIVQPTMGGDGDVDPIQAMGLEELPRNKADFSGYALAVQCMAHPDGTVDVEMLYDSTVLPQTTAEALLSQFEHMIQQLQTRSTSAIGELDLLTHSDVDRIREWNKPVIEAAPHRSCIHELVQAMVRQQPDAPAISAWDGELSYGALNKTAARLAYHLLEHGVGPEVAVGVCMDKSLWAMVSMLAILQAGGVVVGLGTQHPLARIDTIVSDAGIKIVLADKSQASRLIGHVPHPIEVNASFIETLSDNSEPPHLEGLTPDNAAWIVYTSGSTGNPKGVVLSHAALCTGMLSHGTIFGNNNRTRALQYASHTFGVVMEDMFTTLIFGGCTCIPSEDARLDMNDLARTIRDMDVNFINVTSTTASMLDPNKVPGVKTVVLGGEAVRPAVVDLWLNHARVLNAYGQSECSVESVISILERAEDATNIGFPIGGCAAWVVDTSDWNQLVPVGTPGELLIQGPLLARGYLNDPDKTATSFVTDPKFLRQLDLLPGSGHRLYRTGDLVQQNDDGSMIYLGRCDSQIKVRGQRVEPGEIENQIVQCFTGEVSHAFVDVVALQQGSDPVLVAAIELSSQDSEADSADSNDGNKYDLPPTVRQPSTHITSLIQRIRNTLLKELPPYMVPSYFVPMVQHLPVNASGKLDRRATRNILTTLDRHQLEASTRGKKSQPQRPLTETELQLREAYAEVLGRSAEDIGLEDTFIELGGDSVAAMRVAATCRQRFGLTVRVRDLLQKQSIEGLAPHVQKSGVLSDQQLDNPQQSLSSLSDAATDIQEWMLDYHMARPDIGMTYFSLDGPGSLTGNNKMADTLKNLFSSVEILHTGFVQNKAGGWKRAILDGFVPDVRTYTTTDGSIDDWTVQLMSNEGSRPIRPDHPLADVAICTTSTQHRILFRLSHAIWDGMCIQAFWSTLKDIFETGRARDNRATFSQYVAEVERLRTPDATDYWDDLLQGSTMTPIGSLNKPSTGNNGYVYRAAVLGPGTIKAAAHRLPHNTTCANVIKAAWSLVLARHAGRRDVVFADIVSGRSGVDTSVANAMGCCSTPIPVRVRLADDSTYVDLVQSLQRQQLESIPYETFGLYRAIKECTEWPEGTPATSWINHVPARVDAGEEIMIGNTKYVLGQPAAQEEKKWTFSEVRIAWTVMDGTGDLEFHLVYAADVVGESVAQKLYDEMVSTLERILEAPGALISERFLEE